MKKGWMIVATLICVFLVSGCSKESEQKISHEQQIEKNSPLEKQTAHPVAVNDQNFDRIVLESDLPVLVDFWAPWCGPCRVAGPVVEKIARQYQGRLKVCKLNVDEGRQTAMRHGINSIPTLTFFKDGHVVDQLIGVSPDYESDLKEKIESNI